MPTTQKIVKAASSKYPMRPETKTSKTWAWMPLARSGSRGDGHGDEQFDLVMQPAFVVEEADGGDERGAGDDASALCSGGTVEREEDGEHDPAIHRESTEERNRLKMNFARPGEIDHADAESERANGGGQHQR